MTQQEFDTKVAQLKDVLKGVSPEEMQMLFARAMMPEGGYTPQDLGLYFDDDDYPTGGESYEPAGYYN